MKKDRIKSVVILMSVSVAGLIAIQFYWIAHMASLERVRFERNVSVALTEVADKLEGKEAVKVVLETLDKDTGHKFFALNSDDSTKNNNLHSRTKIISSSGNSFRFITDSSLAYKYAVTANGYTVTANSDSGIANVKIETHLDTINNSVNKDVNVSVTSNAVWIKKKELINEAVDKIFTFGKNKKITERVNEKEIDSLLANELNGKGIYTDYQFVVNNRNSGNVLFSNPADSNIKFGNTHFKVKLFPQEFFQTPNYLLVKFPHKNLYIIKSVGLMLLLSIFIIAVIVAVFYKTIKMLMNQKKITEIKNDLINNITHEFKTPVSTISLACEALNEPALTTDKSAIEKYSGIIKEENNRLGLLVENLLNSAAIEKGNYELRKKETNINELLKSSAQKFENKIAELNGSLCLHLDENIKNINIDSFHLLNAFNNLLDNAVKYSKENPTINISSENIENGILILFVDNGCGIDKKHQIRIFETFYRVPTGNIHDVKGHGIGLSYVRQMLEAHGGRISVESTKGKGSKFKVFLPYDK